MPLFYLWSKNNKYNTLGMRLIVRYVRVHDPLKRALQGIVCA